MGNLWRAPQLVLIGCITTSEQRVAAAAAAAALRDIAVRSRLLLFITSRYISDFISPCFTAAGWTDVEAKLIQSAQVWSNNHHLSCTSSLKSQSTALCERPRSTALQLPHLDLHTDTPQYRRIPSGYQVAYIGTTPHCIGLASGPSLAHTI